MISTATQGYKVGEVVRVLGFTPVDDLHASMVGQNYPIEEVLEDNGYKAYGLRCRANNQIYYFNFGSLTK